MTLRINRRGILRLSAACSVLLMPWRRIIGAPDPNASLEDFLQVLLRRLFPHPQVPARIYRDVAAGMATAIAKDAGLVALIQQGRKGLDSDDGLPWLDVDEIQQTSRLAEIENTPFFQTLRGMGSFSFYNNNEVWPYFGYEGSSFEKGGYIDRGFDDLSWLPEPES